MPNEFKALSRLIRINDRGTDASAVVALNNDWNKLGHFYINQINSDVAHHKTFWKRVIFMYLDENGKALRNDFETTLNRGFILVRCPILSPSSVMLDIENWRYLNGNENKLKIEVQIINAINNQRFREMTKFEQAEIRAKSVAFKLSRSGGSTQMPKGSYLFADTVNWVK